MAAVNAVHFQPGGVHWWSWDGGKIQISWFCQLWDSVVTRLKILFLSRKRCSVIYGWCFYHLLSSGFLSAYSLSAASPQFLPHWHKCYFCTDLIQVNSLSLQNWTFFFFSSRNVAEQKCLNYRHPILIYFFSLAKYVPWMVDIIVPGDDIGKALYVFSVAYRKEILSAKTPALFCWTVKMFKCLQQSSLFCCWKVKSFVSRICSFLQFMSSVMLGYYCTFFLNDILFFWDHMLPIFPSYTLSPSY